MSNVQNFTLFTGDSMERLRVMESNSIHAVITDPPYEIGYMNQKWDSSGIAYSPSLWSEVLRVLKPGGHLACFGGQKTFHRIASAIEVGGFEIREIFLWLFNNSIPKGFNLYNEAKRRQIPCNVESMRGYVTHSRWGHEPIVLARKPLEGTIFNNFIKHGTGALKVQDEQDRRKANVILQGVNLRGIQNFEEIEPVVEQLLPEGKATLTEKDAGLEELPMQSRLQDGDSAGWDLSKGKLRANMNGKKHNYHPSVKPIALGEWLSKIVVPEGGTVLDPFCGSGSLLIGAMFTGANGIGIDCSSEFINISKLRLKHWAKEKNVDLLITTGEEDETFSD